MPKIEFVKKSLGDQLILNDISIDFPDVGCTVIMGESGCGKTTLLRILAGLEKADSGIVSGFGRENVGMSFQEYRLFPTLSALENASLASPLSKEGAKEAATALLSRLGFTGADMRKKPSALSGGMRQRVSVARAILSEKPILLLDEPTKELDAEMRTTLLSLFKELSESRLLIIVTHVREDAEALGVTPFELFPQTK